MKNFISANYFYVIKKKLSQVLLPSRQCLPELQQQRLQQSPFSQYPKHPFSLLFHS